MTDRIAHYNLLEPLGEGGLGLAYRARDTRSGRTTVVKIVSGAIVRDPLARTRLLDAARRAAELSHPNLVALFEVGEDEERLFLAFEFVRGRSLRAELGGRALNVRHAVELGAQVADALAAAHARGIVHGDLRPDTIMVTAKGLAKILDCGLTLWTRGGTLRRLVAAGSPDVDPRLAAAMSAYLSPEEARGEEADERSDVFALGVVLYEALTGRSPFAPSLPEQVLERVRAAAPPPPSAINPEVPSELDAVVLRALARAPDERYQSAAVVAAELRAVGAMLDIRAGEAEPPRLVTGGAAPRRMGRRAVALLVVAGLAGGGWYLGAGALQRTWRRWTGPPPSPVVQVQPFAATTRSADVFAESLAAELATHLGRKPGLRVVARGAVLGSVTRVVAQRAGAGTLLEGVVGRDGEHFTVTLRLRDHADGFEWWSRQYRGEVAQVFRLLADMAGDVARVLGVTAPPNVADARASSRRVAGQAYELYLQGNRAWARGRLDVAVEQFRRAVTIDPTLAEAYAGLAEALFLEGWRTGALDASDGRAAVEAAAESALQLDPDLPRAHLAAALAAARFPSALDALRRVVGLDPTFAGAYRHLGDRLAGIDNERAIAHHRLATTLEPGWGAGYRSLASALLLAARWDEAIRAVAESRRAGIDEVWQKDVEARVAFARGRYGEAAALLAAQPDRETDVHVWTTLVVAFAAAGERSAALAEAHRLAERYPAYCGARALLAALEGERSRAAARRAFEPPGPVAGPDELPPRVLLCAALAAAAAGNAPAAARWIDQIARRDDAVAEWQQFALYNLLGRLDQAAVLPWTAVAGHAEFARAVRRLVSARERLRPLVARALAGLVP